MLGGKIQVLGLLLFLLWVLLLYQTIICANTLGTGGLTHSMTSSHGTGCAGLSGGKNFGLAFEAKLWTISIFLLQVLILIHPMMRSKYYIK